MFYSNFMFVKKGPLSKIWLAAHFYRKLTKHLVLGTDINISAKSILDPTSPLALRLSGQLLLGLVRIYQKKVKYLQEDCSDALTKMKMTFRPGAVDLPADANIAPVAQITHPDNFELIEYAIPEIPIDNLDDMMMVDETALEAKIDSTLGASQLDTYSAAAPDITLAEDQAVDLGNIDLLGDFNDDSLVPFEDEALGENLLDSRVSDVEVPRAGGAMEEFDIDLPDQNPLGGPNMSAKERSMLEQDLSMLDSTLGADDGFDQNAFVNMDIPETTIDKPKTKPKKRKAAKRDANTELSSEIIRKALADSSDIRLPGNRPTIPFTKRAKLRHSRQKVGLTVLMHRPSGFQAISSGIITIESENTTIAPELLETLQRKGEIVPIERLEDSKCKEDDANNLAATLDEEQGQTEFADEYDFGLMDASLDDSFTNSATAPSPEAEKESKYDEAYSDYENYDRKELEDFFGDAEVEDDEKEEEHAGWSRRTRKMHQVLVNEMNGKKRFVCIFMI